MSFAVGEQVVARVSAQGLTAGSTYTVTAVTRTPKGMFGVFVAYELDRSMFVANGDVMLSRKEQR